MDQINRRIMHIDMDAFYASVEQVDYPELKGKPVIVGGSQRGVVSAASYEARKYGVRSAMPIFQAKRLCPNGIFLPVRMERYKEVSRGIMEILEAVSPLVERVSIDEAYVDITGVDTLPRHSGDLAFSLKRKIYERTSLTCSIGIAPNKFLAKIASDINKPNGVTIIEAHQVKDFLGALPVARIPGVGAKTSQSLRNLGITKTSDILKLPLAFWTKRFGKFGVGLYEKAQGIDASPVSPISEPKSISAEDTFPKDTDDIEEIKRWMLIQAESVGRDLRRHGYRGKTITVKIKSSSFKLLTKSHTLSEPTDCTQIIFATAVRLLLGMDLKEKARLVGLGVSNLSKGMFQIRLFSDASREMQERVDKVMDEIQRKYGDKALTRGRLPEP
jgi:DNA polymerase-4